MANELYTHAVLEVTGLYMLMPMDEVVALLPKLANVQLVDRDWANDSFRIAPKGRRSMAVHPLTAGDVASIAMKQNT